MTRKFRSWLGVAAILLIIPASGWPHGNEHGEEAPTSGAVVLAPGWEKLDYDPPLPGSYSLNDLGGAAGGALRDSNNDAVALDELLAGRITVLSFMYRGCDDINGCPLATYVMRQLGERLEADDQLRSIVRLISVSFDPINDTPAEMATFKAANRTGSVDWRFLTAESDAELQPILQAYGQSIKREPSRDANSTQRSATISHVLRIYLVDSRRRVRNIYSASLLHADTLFNDIRTLLLSQHDQTADDAARSATETQSSAPYAPGDASDDRAGYERADYRSRSLDLKNRRGKPADLLGIAGGHHLGLPQLPALENLTDNMVALGRRLFFDRRLSINNTISCGMCHVPTQGFTVNELATAVGIEGRTVKRNAPTLLNVGYLQSLFHDGRERRLDHQVWIPLLNANEMGNTSIAQVLDSVAAVDGYQADFDRAFPSSGLTMENFGTAIAAYEMTLVAANSPFDRWYYGADSGAVSDGVKAGFRLFMGKGRCAACHTVAKDWALFTDQKLHNTGLGYAQSMNRSRKPRTVNIAPGVSIDIAPEVYAAAAEAVPNDLGRYEVTQNPDDRWKFKTPSLRNVALTAPYMHNGSLTTLEDVVDFYNQGGIANEGLSPVMQPLNLAAREQAQLVEFLRALTGDNVSVLVGDAMAAPIGDTIKAAAD